MRERHTGSPRDRQRRAWLTFVVVAALGLVPPACADTATDVGTGYTSSNATGELSAEQLTLGDNNVRDTPAENRLSLHDNAVNLTPDPTCAASGVAGMFTLIDADESATADWQLCNGTSIFADLVNTGSDAIAAGEVLIGTGAGTGEYRELVLGTDTSGSYAAGDGEAGNATGLACSDCVALGSETTGAYVTDITGGAGLTASGGGSETATVTLATASTEAAFLADGGTTDLTCGASAQGKLQVLDDGQLQWCDGATTSALRRAAFGDASGNATGLACTDCVSGTEVAFNYAGSASEGGPATTALALDANPADCAANQFATTIAADGDLTCAALTDADVPDDITIDLAAAATALAANGANCSAGSYPLGVDASGAVESCTADQNTNAATLCTGTTTYLDGEGNCDDIAAVYAAASHAHAAGDVTSGTLAHERGGLEADVSAYSGLVRISAGATSAVTNLAGLNTALGSSIADGPHTTDTNAGTLCAGTTTYLDGEGNCDDISAAYAAAAHTHNYAGAASPGAAATTALALDANPSDCGAGEFATAIAADGDLTCAAITLGTDTTGNYVSGATANQGLLLTGAEGASLGLIDCAANEVLKRNAGDTAWECAADLASLSLESGDVAVPNGSASTLDFDSRFSITCASGECEIVPGSQFTMLGSTIEANEMTSTVAHENEPNDFGANQQTIEKLDIEKADGTTIADCNISADGDCRYTGSYSHADSLATKSDVSARVSMLFDGWTQTHASNFATRRYLRDGVNNTLVLYTQQIVPIDCTMQTLHGHVTTFGSWPSGATITIGYIKNLVSTPLASCSFTASNTSCTSGTTNAFTAGERIAFYAECSGTCTDTGTTIYPIGSVLCTAN